MSFLNQLKSQASALQGAQSAQSQDLEINAARAEAACKTIWLYFSELARQLNIIAPAGPRFTLDGKKPWPAMKLVNFRVDARKKTLRNNKEGYDHIAMGWQIVPQVGAPVGGTVSANFPPELQRIESRLALGGVKHERREVRHPEKNTLLELRFDYLTESRGNVMATPDHDKAIIAFRLANANGFELINTSYPAAQITTELLDELAKLLVAQPTRFG
ncbi:MAG: hypothetical protein Q8K31_06045 [Burkholderiaceae bacterium]|nr:hypothetical protein [Burkholderiaceae bacterium]MDP1968729.1 hypothetical protein [Burkholderiaceae bacterium]